MKKLILAFALLTTANAQTVESKFEGLLQENLCFSGTTKVTYIADAFGLYTRVYFNVTTLDETRANSCEIAIENNAELIRDCDENWFYCSEGESL